MGEMVIYAAVLVAAVVGIHGGRLPMLHVRPKTYDESFTLRVDTTTRSFDGYWRWMDFKMKHKLTESTFVMKRDAEAERFQMSNSQGVFQIQQKEEDGKIWTYDIDESASTCKRYIRNKSWNKNGSLRSGGMTFARGKVTNTESKGNIFTLKFVEDYYDLSGDYQDIWVVRWNTDNNSYLPQSHMEIHVDDYEGPDLSFAKVVEKKYTPVEEDWFPVPEYCG